MFITSDWHFNHSKDFLLGPRGFVTAEEMNEAIIERHNATVGKNDIVYCLGDCIMGDIDESLRLLSRLNGKIHIIRGNHDTDRKIQGYLSLPNVIEADKYADILKISKRRRIYLSHYPTLVGNIGEEHIDIFNVCGHSHTNNPFLDFDKRCFHAEMETNDCRPWALEEIISLIDKKKFDFV